jgi:hypothetical protein
MDDLETLGNTDKGTFLKWKYLTKADAFSPRRF